MIKAKNNILSIKYPDLAKEWNYEKNGELRPDEVTSGSGKKVWWKCSKGHEWEAVVSSRVRGNGCPYCSGKRVIKGFNDFATMCSDIAKEWNYEKNDDLKPEELSFKSHKNVWWICEKCGHEWQATIKNRTCGTNCPICSRSIVAKKRIAIFIDKRGDLATNRPELIKEWHPTKNGDLNPSKLTVGSNINVWWKCSKGHEWQAQIVVRTSGNNCPYCSGHRVLIGENDLETTHPDIAKEWHPTKNGKLTAKEFTYGSGKRIWWICAKGHEWQTPIAYRTIDKTGCPYCAKELQTSFPEQAILYYVRKCFSDVINNDRNVLEGKELDIYIPSIKTAVEYDGIAWHRNEKRDNVKLELCLSKGIRLIRIREAECNKLEHIDDTYNCIAGDRNMLNTIIKDICFDLAKQNIDVDTERDALAIQEQYITSAKESSLAFSYPDIAKEWHPTKNGILDATMFFSGSGKRFWWQCSKGHEWQSTILNRVQGRGCPYCSGRYPVPGENDLATMNPIVAQEWHPTKNRNSKPSDYLPNSGKKVWWICKNGHEWQDTINHRTNNRGCPYCSGHKVLIGFNDL